MKYMKLSRVAILSSVFSMLLITSNELDARESGFFARPPAKSKDSVSNPTEISALKKELKLIQGKYKNKSLKVTRLEKEIEALKKENETLKQASQQPAAAQSNQPDGDNGSSNGGDADGASPDAAPANQSADQSDDDDGSSDSGDADGASPDAAPANQAADQSDDDDGSSDGSDADGSSPDAAPQDADPFGFNYDYGDANLGDVKPL